MQFGLVLINLALDSRSTEVRRNLNGVIAAATILKPMLTNQIIREALASFLARKPFTHNSTSDDVPFPWSKHARLSGLLLSAVSFKEGTEACVREEAVVELIVLVHHRLICSCFTSRDMMVYLLC